MFELTGMEWIVVYVAAVFVGIAKTGIAGLGIVVVPIMATVFPPKDSTGILLCVLIMADVIAVWYYNRHANWTLLKQMFPPAIIGILIGWAIMGQINNTQLRIIIGIVVLVLIALSVMRDKGIIADEKIPLSGKKGTVFAWVAGMAVGVTTMLANAAGPIFVVYALLRKLPKNEFIGTGAWFFLCLNVFKVPFSWQLGFVTPESLLFDVKLLPGIIVGGIIGIWLVKRMSNKSFTFWVQLLAVASAIKLLIG